MVDIIALGEELLSHSRLPNDLLAYVADEFDGDPSC